MSPWETCQWKNNVIFNSVVVHWHTWRDCTLSGAEYIYHNSSGNDIKGYPLFSLIQSKMGNFKSAWSSQASGGLYEEGAYKTETRQWVPSAEVIVLLICWSAPILYHCMGNDINLSIRRLREDAEIGALEINSLFLFLQHQRCRFILQRCMMLTGGGEFTDVERHPRCTYGCFINSESKREMRFNGLVHSKMKMLCVFAQPLLMLLSSSEHTWYIF